MASLSQFGYMHSSLVYSGWLTDWLTGSPSLLYLRETTILFVCCFVNALWLCLSHNKWASDYAMNRYWSGWCGAMGRYWTKICTKDIQEFVPTYPVWTPTGHSPGSVRVSLPGPTSSSSLCVQSCGGEVGGGSGVEWAGSLSVWRWFWFCCNRLAHFLSSLAPLIMAEHLFGLGFRISQLFALIKHKHRHTHTLSWTDENSSKQK